MQSKIQTPAFSIIYATVTTVLKETRNAWQSLVCNPRGIALTPPPLWNR